MPVRQNPFSIYDFLGYFIPGAVSLYGILGSAYHASPDRMPIEAIQNAVPLGEVGIYVPFILLSYLLGHLLSYISSVLVEKYAVWMYDYPSKYLLQAARTPFGNGAGLTRVGLARKAFAIAVMLPVVIPDLLIGQLFGVNAQHRKSLDPLLLSIVKRKTLSLIKKKAGVQQPMKYGNEWEYDFFRYLYHYSVEFCPNHLPKMQNYVALFGLLRTVCLMFVILFWIGVWHVWFSSAGLVPATLWLGSAASLAYIFFMGFMKFYRRFSLETLMAVAVTLPEQQVEPDEPELGSEQSYP